MDWEILSLILLATLGVLLLLGQWSAFALGCVGMLILYLSRGSAGLTSVSSIMWNTANNYILVAIPLFLFMGEVILRSGVSTHFYRGVSAIVGRTPGGLFHANIVACGLFSAVSGSSVATAASVGTVAIPEMTKRGYDRKMLYGSLAAGGTLGILLPPSIIMILYGALVEESIAKLFIAGILPGILLSLLFIIYMAVRVRLDKSLAPVDEEVLNVRERLAYMWHILPIIALLVAVLGGIYSGFATPTEAAAIGAVGSLVLAQYYRMLSFDVLKEALASTVRTSCMVIFIIVGAQILSYALSFAGISRGISEWVTAMELSRWVFFAAIVLLYVILGFFVDGISMIYITLPVLYPAVQAAGFDPIWFGIVLTILIELGQITPPVGLNLFAIHGIAKDAKFSDVAIGSVPFVFIMLFLILLLAIFPGIALWLPSLM